MNGEDEHANLLRLLAAAGYGAEPEVAPQMAPSPGFRLGPLKVGGGTLDNASASILQSMKGGMPRPRNTGEALGGGFLQGFAQARAGRAQARSQQYEGAAKGVADRNEARQKFLEKSIGEAEQERNIRTRPSAEKAENASMVDITDTPDLQKALLGRGALIPPPNARGRIVVPASFLSPKDPLVQERRKQIIDLANELGGISPGAMKFWAEKSVGMGGEIPPGLSRNPAMLRAFLENTAAEASKVGMNGYAAADRRAYYRAEAAALTDVTRTSERAKPFAALLHKNVDILRGTMQRVRDTGTIFGNKIVRGIVRQMGDKDQSRFNTALVPVAKEAARLLESTNLTGTLSVDAQKELRAIVSGNFTLPQLEGALEIIEAETNNRIEAYDEATGNIMSPAPGQTSPGVVPPKGNERAAEMLKAVQASLKPKKGGKP